MWWSILQTVNLTTKKSIVKSRLIPDRYWISALQTAHVDFKSSAALPSSWPVGTSISIWSGLLTLYWNLSQKGLAVKPNILQTNGSNETGSQSAMKFYKRQMSGLFWHWVPGCIRNLKTDTRSVTNYQHFTVLCTSAQLLHVMSVHTDHWQCHCHWVVLSASLGGFRTGLTRAMTTAHIAPMHAQCIA